MPAAIRRRVNSPRRKSLLGDRTRTKAEFKAVMDAAAEAIKREFEDAVSDWSEDNRPEFIKDAKVTTDEFRIAVRPRKNRRASKIFEYVDKGTPPHRIAAKKAKTLAFTAGKYSPKTLPIAQAHVGTGAVAGGTAVFPKVVQHPGTEARLFSETIHDRRAPEFRREVENLFRRLERDAQRSN